MLNNKEIAQIAKEIFEIVFEKIDFETFYYKHFSNPFALPQPLEIYKIGEEIVGLNAFDRVEFLVGGKKCMAVQSGDSAVLEAYRGRGIFTNIQTNVLPYLATNQVNIEFGFPNPTSYKGFMKLGWKSIDHFFRYIRILNIGNVLNDKFHTTIFTKLNIMDFLCRSDKCFYDITDSNVCPFSDDDIEKVNFFIKTGVCRSRQYYQWRIDGNKTYQFYYVTARSGMNLEGFFIYRTKRIRELVFVEIVDWYIDSNLPKAEQQKLLGVLMRRIKKIGDVVSIQYVSKSRDEDRILRRAGFIKRGKRPALVIFNVIDNDEKICNEVSKNLILREVDVDIIMN